VLGGQGLSGVSFTWQARFSKLHLPFVGFQAKIAFIGPWRADRLCRRILTRLETGSRGRRAGSAVLGVLDELPAEGSDVDAGQ